jgi:hypothetical protein
MFDSLVQRLERMADGISRHKQEDGFPKPLDDIKLRAQRQELENLREKYEAQAKAAAIAYDAFKAAFQGAKETLGKDDELVRGFYGKKNPVIADFGTKVPAVRRSKKAASAAKQKA